MAAHPEVEIAAVIRRHPNNADADILGTAIAQVLDNEPRTADVVANIIRRVNPNRTMGAGNLAEAIWTELDEIPWT